MNIKEVVGIGTHGEVMIPEQIRKIEHINAGDLVDVIDVNGAIIIKKIDTDIDVKKAIQEFGSLLRESGYDTREEITRMVDEVKEEVAEEWEEKIN